MRISLGLALLLCGCAGSSMVTTDEHEPKHEIRKIATDPESLTTGNAIAKALNARDDFEPEMLTAEATRELLKELGIDPARAVESKNLTRLPAKGVDGWMDIHTNRFPPQTGDIKTIRVRLISTRDPTRVLMIEWKNSWAGAPGSPADRWARKDLPEAAEVIAEEIAEQINER